jgi:hypothetical protein
MAGPPSTRNWNANELPDLVGRHYRIVVTGDVEVSATNLTPKLSLHAPQGFNPRILLLDLTIVSSGGFGGQIMLYKSVMFTRATSGNRYDEVDILFRGRIIKRIKVGHPKTLRAAAKRKSARKKKR